MPILPPEKQAAVWLSLAQYVYPKLSPSPLEDDEDNSTPPPSADFEASTIEKMERLIELQTILNEIDKDGDWLSKKIS